MPIIVPGTGGMSNKQTEFQASIDPIAAVNMWRRLTGKPTLEEESKQQQMESILQGLLTQPAPEGGVSISSESPIQQQQNESEKLLQARQMISGLAPSEEPTPTAMNPLEQLQQFFRSRSLDQNNISLPMEGIITGSPEPNVSPQGNFLLNLPSGQMMDPRQYGMAKAAMMTNPDEFGKALSGMMFPKPATNEYSIQEGYLINKNTGDKVKLDVNKVYKGHTDLGDKVLIHYSDGSEDIQDKKEILSPKDKAFNDLTAEEKRQYFLKPLVSSETKIENFTPANIEAQKKFMDKVSENWDTLKNAPAQIANIEKAKSLIPSAAAFMGPLGTTKLNVVKFFRSNLNWGMEIEGVKSAEELQTRLFSQILDNLKKLDAQPSEAQQKMMMNALGNLGTDPQAMTNVLNAIEETIQNRVDIHNQVIDSANKNIQWPFDPHIKLGMPSKSEGDNLKKKYGLE